MSPPPSTFASDVEAFTLPMQFEHYGETITYAIPGDADRSFTAIPDTSSSTIKRGGGGHTRDQTREARWIVRIDEADADGLPAAKLADVAGHKITAGTDTFNVTGIAERGAGWAKLLTQLVKDLARRNERTTMSR